MYCSLADARAELKAEDTVDNDRLLRYVRQVSARIDRIMSPRNSRPLFEPYLESRLFLVTPQAINSRMNSFTFRQPLMAFSEVLVGTGDVTSSVEAFPLGQAPIRALRIRGGASSWYDWCASSLDPVYITITGVWGIRSDYANAWVTYDAVQTNPVAPSDGTFAVADVDGDDPYGIDPRFSPGQLLHIGDGPEILRTTATTVLTNLLAVQRAQNGSELPSGNYAPGDAVKVFEAEDPIRRVVARQAALMYARLGAFQVETLDGVGVVTYPEDLLAELRDVLTDYQYI